MAQTVDSNVEVTRLAGTLGAQVRGFDLAVAGPEEAEAIRSLLLEHLVLFLPGQRINVDEHINFGRHFGTLESHPNLKNPFTDRDELFELAASHGGIADEWHTDLTFQERPAVTSAFEFGLMIRMRFGITVRGQRRNCDRRPVRARVCRACRCSRSSFAV